jgi:hypothetical protein
MSTVAFSAKSPYRSVDFHSRPFRLMLSEPAVAFSANNKLSGSSIQLGIALQ